MSTKPGVTNAPIGVDVALTTFADRGLDGGDAITDDPDIAVVRGRPGAVHDHTPANHDVEAHSVRSQQAPAGACLAGSRGYLTTQP